MPYQVVRRVGRDRYVALPASEETRRTGRLARSPLDDVEPREVWWLHPPGQVVAEERYDLPLAAEAFFWRIMQEIGRVYANLNQKEWAPDGEYDDPHIRGIRVRPYWWGDLDAPEARLPNFQWAHVKIWWHKHPGRGMETNVQFTLEEWVDWYGFCMMHLASIDRSHAP